MMLLLVVRLQLAEYLRGRFELLRREALVTDDRYDDCLALVSASRNSIN